MYVSYNRDPEICPLYRGVRYRGVSIKWGFTVCYIALRYTEYMPCAVDFSRGFWYSTLPCPFTLKGALNF